MIRRREFITLLGGVTLISLCASQIAHAQQPVTPLVGFLNAQKSADFQHVVAAYIEGLHASGFVEGRNVAIAYRWAEGNYERLPALAAEMARLRPAVIAATGGDASARAAKAATTSIPVVFTIGGDPVDLKFVESLNRPGGNLTGLTQYTAAIETKRLELLHDLAPGATAVALLVNPNNPNIDVQLRDLPPAARAIGLHLTLLKAATEAEIDATFAVLAGQKLDALFVASDPFFNSRREQIVALAMRRAVPTIFHQREFATAGGLISYGSSAIDMYRQAAIYTARILKGAKPADLPVLQPTKFELVINLKTAKQIGVEVPAKLLAIADEVIE
jgi:putative ABC transport system substrate-binding protein